LARSCKTRSSSIEPGTVIGDFFKQMKDAAEHWDGSNAVIPL
jgi:hypothetical protein